LTQKFCSNPILQDRFTVQTVGRLRLDKLSNLIEAFLKEYGTFQANNADDPPPILPNSTSAVMEPSGPLYVQDYAARASNRRDVEQEIESAIPLHEALARSEVSPGADLQLSSSKRVAASLPDFRLEMKSSSFVDNVPSIPHLSSKEDISSSIPEQATSALVPNEQRQRKKMINRRGTSNLDNIGNEQGDPTLDYLTVPDFYANSGEVAEPRAVPLIPFDEIMLIETLGAGRVSTIYRAAWQRSEFYESPFPVKTVKMVALKVAMVDPATRNTAYVDELRREADIAARLSHPNVCDLGTLLCLVSESNLYTAS
jgi:hypothetical protein